MLRGRAALEQGAFAEAEPWLRRAAAADPSAPEALHSLVHCLRAQDKKTEADQLAARVEQLLVDLKRLDELIRAIGRQPNDARPRHDAGVIALRIGRPQEGLGWLQDALRAQGDHRPSHAVLADYYQQKGESARSEFHRRLAQ
jgi:Tfp pilus assembly protein PilF